MQNKILMIRHMEPRRDDRVSTYLSEQGWQLQWCFPANGESLPHSTEEFAAMVVYGGSQSVNDNDKPYLHKEIDWIEKWLTTNKPLLGICLGAQLLAKTLGANVSRHTHGLHEIGYVEIEPTESGKKFLASPLHVYHWHNEGFELPVGATPLASGGVFPNQAYRYGRCAFGIQFHPEVSPDIFSEWIKEAGHMLKQPGAHNAERQLADAKQFDAGMHDWLNAFMRDWQGSWPVECAA